MYDPNASQCSILFKRSRSRTKDKDFERGALTKKLVYAQPRLVASSFAVVSVA